MTSWKLLGGSEQEGTQLLHCGYYMENPKDDEDPKERLFLRLFQILKLVENFATRKYVSKVEHSW